MRRRIGWILTAAVLLTGCAGTEQQGAVQETTAPLTTQAQTTASETSTAQTTSADAQTTARADLSEITAPPMTHQPIETEPILTAASQPEISPDDQWMLELQLSSYLLNLKDTFDTQTEIALNGTGYVHAESGLRLRDKPSANGKQLISLKDGSTVAITAVAVSGDVWNWENRWFRVKADGKEGYVSARYVAAQFPQKASELSEAQLKAMSVFLYHQTQDLFMLFIYDGGFSGRGKDLNDTLSGDLSNYARMKPASLTAEKLYEEFYRYFSRQYHENCLTRTTEPQYYQVMDGKLYGATGYGDNVYVDHYTLETLRRVSDTEIAGEECIYYTKDFQMNDDGFEKNGFMLVYEDGYWKAGRCHVY